METKYEIVPIFPTPIYINEIPEQLVQDHIFLLDNEKILGKEDDVPVENYGGVSQNTYILNQPQYQNLSNYIIQHSTNFAENYMSYNYVNYKFSQSWISIKFPQQEHLPHTHSFSLISGVLFYGDFIDETSHITFHRKDKISEEFNAHITKDHTNEFSFLQYDIYFKPNLLILFPSTLPHSVSKNITDIPRKSLAFNVVPRDGFGKEDSLTELKFNN